MQRYADLSRMSEVQFREFLSGCELDPWERDEIWQQEDRNAYYVKHVYWHRLADTKTTVRESHVYLLKNGIFLTSPVKEKFTMLDGLVWDALAEHEFNTQYEQLPRKSEKVQLLLNDGSERLKAVEAEVQSRLWSSDASAP